MQLVACSQATNENRSLSNWKRVVCCKYFTQLWLWANSYLVWTRTKSHRCQGSLNGKLFGIYCHFPGFLSKDGCMSILLARRYHTDKFVDSSGRRCHCSSSHSKLHQWKFSVLLTANWFKASQTGRHEHICKNLWSLAYCIPLHACPFTALSMSWFWAVTHDVFLIINCPGAQEMILRIKDQPSTSGRVNPMFVEGDNWLKCTET